MKSKTIFARHIQTSVIDYPPYVSRVFYATKCCFRCAYCYSMRSLAKADVLSEGEFMDEIRKSVVGADAIVLLGGEPLLERVGILRKAIETAHAEGLKVKMFTTLMIPNNLFEKRKDLLRSFDALQVDVKTLQSGKHDWLGSFYDPFVLLGRLVWVKSVPEIIISFPAYPLASWSGLEEFIGFVKASLPQAKFRVHNLVMLEEWLMKHPPSVLQESFDLARSLYGRIKALGVEVKLDITPFKGELVSKGVTKKEDNK